MSLPSVLSTPVTMCTILVDETRRVLVAVGHKGVLVMVPKPCHRPKQEYAGLQVGRVDMQKQVRVLLHSARGQFKLNRSFHSPTLLTE